VLTQSAKKHKQPGALTIDTADSTMRVYGHKIMALIFFY